MTDLKICGLHPDDDLSFTDHRLITHVGLVFVPESRRFITPRNAKTVVERLEKRANPVGVFVNESYDLVLQTADKSGIAIAQLHGGESPEYCAALKRAGLQVWKALSVPSEMGGIHGFVEQLATFRGKVDALLLDASPPKGAPRGVSGGHGHPFPWEMLPLLPSDVVRETPMWVAGGLTPTNVRELFQTYQPTGVDVSSGVEINGRKSPERIAAMIEAVASCA